MLRIETVYTDDHPGLKPYRERGRDAEIDQEKWVVAPGEKIVRRLLESPLKVESLLLTAEWLENLRPLWSVRPEEITAYLADKQRLQRIVGHSMYQGVLALARHPQPSGIADLAEAASGPGLWVALEGLSNAENVGAIVRCCAALGGQGLLVDSTCCSPYLTRAVRASMGAIFTLPVAGPGVLPGMLRELKARGTRVIAAHPRADAARLNEIDLRTSCCLVFGSEDRGLSAEILALADCSLTIPMARGIDSLNVSHAVGICLYECLRQRQG